MDNILINLMKGISALNPNLTKEQLGCIKVIEHLKIQLRKMNDYVDIEIQEHWIQTAKEGLKDKIIKNCIPNFKKPKKGYSIDIKAFKRVNGQLLHDLQKTIKNLPDSVLLKHQDAEKQIVPDELVHNTRGYINKLTNQINVTYQTNCFDACSMCMRRLLEVLLILTYQKNGIKEDILDSPDKYKNLNFIINYTKSNNQFDLSNVVLKTMDEFRKLGNNSAHRIEYNCVKREIDDVKNEFRVTVEELLYASGIKK